jgi:hypothetical protein
MLGDRYVEANMPVVKRRLHQASLRLAMVLNEQSGGTVYYDWEWRDARAPRRVSLASCGGEQ